MLTYDQTSLVRSFPHSHPFPSSALLIKLWSVRGLPTGSLPLYLHIPLHLPRERHLRCLATWRALCYCREKHSRAILTPPQRHSPLSSPSLALPRWAPCTLSTWCKIKDDFPFSLNGTEKRPIRSHYWEHFKTQRQPSTSYRITLFRLWFTDAEANWYRRMDASVSSDQSADEMSLLTVQRNELHMKRFGLTDFLLINFKGLSNYFVQVQRKSPTTALHVPL